MDIFKEPVHLWEHNSEQNNELCGVSPRANYTDRAIAACQQS
jgi:hypothetical protein